MPSGNWRCACLFDTLGQLRLHQVTAGALCVSRLSRSIPSIRSIGSSTLPLDFDIFCPSAIAHQSVHVNGAEGHLVAQVQGHHDHPRDPEENDVEPVTSTMPGWKREFLRVLGPAKGARRSTGPMRTRCPGHLRPGAAVRFRRASVLTRARRLVGADIDVALGVIPGGDPVPPPELPADAPVLNVAHPGEIGVLPLAWVRTRSAPLPRRRNRRARPGSSRRRTTAASGRAR
jgi:hypothetical protein